MHQNWHRKQKTVRKNKNKIHTKSQNNQSTQSGNATVTLYAHMEKNCVDKKEANFSE